MKALLIRLKEKGDLTIGKLLLEDGSTYDTIELLWKNNMPKVSSIPTGKYKFKTDWSNNKQRQVIELEGVPNRSQIQIHSGTKSEHILGCIGVSGRTIENEIFNKLKDGGQLTILNI